MTTVTDLFCGAGGSSIGLVGAGLEPAEIGRAQAFPDTYRVAGSKRDVVRQYGNAVSPPAAALLAERVLEVLR